MFAVTKLPTVVLAVAKVDPVAGAGGGLELYAGTTGPTVQVTVYVAGDAIFVPLCVTVTVVWKLPIVLDRQVIVMNPVPPFGLTLKVMGATEKIPVVLLRTTLAIESICVPVLVILIGAVVENPTGVLGVANVDPAAGAGGGLEL